MTIDFNSKNFENPDIQSLYSHIQALALEEEQVEKPEDYLEPDYNGLKTIEPIIENFKNSVFNEEGYINPEVQEEKDKNLKKRPRPQSGATKGEKVEKKSGRMETEGDLTEDEMYNYQALINNGKGDKLTKNELVKYLRAKGLSTQGNKSDLISRALKKLKTE